MENKYQKAAEMFEKAAEAEKTGSNPRRVDLILELNYAGICCSKTGQRDKVIAYATQIREQQLDAAMSDLEGWINADSLRKNGKYLEAAQLYEKGAKLERNHAPIFVLTTSDKNPAPRLGYLSYELAEAAFCYRQIGLYDKAIETYQQALVVDSQLNQKTNKTEDLNDEGGVFHRWGNLCNKEIGGYSLHSQQQDTYLRHNRPSASSTLTRIGDAYNALGQHDNALKYLQQALELDKKYGKESDISIELFNIGDVYFSIGQFAKAYDYLGQAQTINNKLKHQAGVDTSLIGILNSGAGNWNEWRKHNPSVEPNLQGAIVTNNRQITVKDTMLKVNEFLDSTFNADLANADLHNVNFIGASLLSANLQGANLQGAKLDQSYLVGSNLLNANLQNANFFEATLWGAKLSGVSFQGDTLTGADLSMTNLSGVNFRNANLIDVKLGMSDLSNADFQGANLSRADLHDANLLNANFQESDLKGVNLKGTDLSIAKSFYKAKLDSIVLSEIKTKWPDKLDTVR